MKTTQTIHLAQRLITIDTDAWKSLEQYLNALKKYFATEESGDEIYADIENRVSEIMSQQLKDGKVSISNDDVQEIIGIVGDLKTLGIDETATENTSNNNTANENVNQDSRTNTQQESKTNTQQQFYSGPKRLMRNGNDRIISGLCSGVANYLNIDPIWVRLVFFVFLLPAGIGLLAYILGSIFIPKSYDTIYNSKRLFRDTEHKVIGGVCSGIAAYFHTNPLYIRLLFLSPILFSIIASSNDHWDFGPHYGFVNTPFFGIYLLLLILLPKAKTPSEKLQMRGEAINVNTIRNQVYGTNTRITPVQHSSLASIIGVLIKGFMYVVVGFMLFVTTMVCIGLFSGGSVVMKFSDYLFREGHQTMLAQFGWILFCATPIVFVVLLVVKKLQGASNQWPRNLFSYLGLAWLFGLFCLIALSKEMITDFKISKDAPGNNVIYEGYAGNTLRVKLAKNNLEESDLFGEKFNSIHIQKDSAVVGNVSIKIEKSADAYYHYSTVLFSRGESNKDCENRIQQMQFNPIFKDSILELPLGYVLRKGQLWRGQKINVTIYVPEGKQILIENSVNSAFSNVELNTKPGNFNIHSYNDFNYDTDKWYLMQNGALYNDGEALETKQNQIEEAQQAIEDAKEELINTTNGIKEELQEELDDAQEELNNELNGDSTSVTAVNITTLKNKIDLLKNSLDSVQAKLTISKDQVVTDAQKKLDEAKRKLDSLKGK